MKIRQSYSFFRWIFLGLIVISVGLLAFELILFSRKQANYPAGMTIAEVPVGDLSREQTIDRLRFVYSQSVELYYDDQIIHLNPGLIQFELDLQSMLAAADLQKPRGSQFWGNFWDYLWGRSQSVTPVPIIATYSEPLLENYLNFEIATRYDQPAQVARPVPGTAEYLPATTGSKLDIDTAVSRIEKALFSPTQRYVTLPINATVPERQAFSNLETQLRQIIDVSGFDGVAGIYIQDLKTGEELHFIVDNGENINPEPDIAVTAASTIKIPIMISSYLRIDEQPTELIENWLVGMIEQSGNDPADWLIQTLMDPDIGPMMVTEDMQEIGLNSTFLAGFFYNGAPLIYRYETPGNSRTDINLNPDLYNQTTVSEIGMLVSDLYECAENNGGALLAAFPNQISQNECQQMINLLKGNKLPNLLEGGIPDGTPIAHKHGWITDNSGAIRTISDAGIIYTPAGDYAISINFYHPVQAVFDSVSLIFRQLSAAVYNFYNFPVEDISK